MRLGLIVIRGMVYVYVMNLLTLNVGYRNIDRDKNDVFAIAAGQFPYQIPYLTLKKTCFTKHLQMSI